MKEADTEQPSIFNGIFELENELKKARLHLMVKRGSITGATMETAFQTILSFLDVPN
ncbi:conserved hypothetical protein [delta proteobacterium NaphS2]|nr:conserved hypothetical protein [delta proteobacterium NaphS2]